MDLEVFGCVEFDSEVRIDVKRFLAHILIPANQIIDRRIATP